MSVASVTNMRYGNTMQYHAISCKTMQYYAKPCTTIQYHAIPCNTMQYSAIPCNTMQYHAIPRIINNCWRSVPLPCGQYKAILLSLILCNESCDQMGAAASTLSKSISALQQNVREFLYQILLVLLFHINVHIHKFPHFLWCVTNRWEQNSGADCLWASYTPSYTLVSPPQRLIALRCMYVADHYTRMIWEINSNII